MSSEAMGMTKEDYRIEAIIERGTKAVGKLVDDLDCKPVDERGNHHARDLTDCLRALVEIQKDQRAAVEFMERHKPNPEQLLQMLTSYLREMPPSEFVALAESVRGQRAS